MAKLIWLLLILSVCNDNISAQICSFINTNYNIRYTGLCCCPGIVLNYEGNIATLSHIDDVIATGFKPKKWLEVDSANLLSLVPSGKSEFGLEQNVRKQVSTTKRPASSTTWKPGQKQNPRNRLTNRPRVTINSSSVKNTVEQIRGIGLAPFSVPGAGIQKVVAPIVKTTLKPITSSQSHKTPTKAAHQAVEIKMDNITYREIIQTFSQSMLTEISKDHKGNLVFSPLSIHIAICMLAHGSSANSKTRMELLRALGFVRADRTNDLTNLESQYADIFVVYNQLALKAVTTANRIWTSKSTRDKIEQNYLDILNQTYSADVGDLTETPENTINKWVSQKTGGKINKIVKGIDSRTVMLLTNAVYFKESWTSSFILTEEPLDFTRPDGSKVKAEMMKKITYEIVTAQFTFEKILPGMKMTMVSMRYASDNGRFQIVLVMPEVHTSLQQLMDHLANQQGSEKIFETIHKVVQEASLETGERIVTMPVFNIKSDIKVEEYLKKLGVQAALSEAAEFGEISKKVSLYVTAISHSATVEVTTEGTSGAAATGVEFSLFSGLSLPDVVTLDKPFFFMIKDTLLNTILFVGKVTDPTQS